MAGHCASDGRGHGLASPSSPVEGPMALLPALHKIPRSGEASGTNASPWLRLYILIAVVLVGLVMDLLYALV